MNNSLSRLNNTPVSSYITDINPIGNKTILNPNGTLVIFDNTGDPNIQNLISSNYALFVDDVFIGGGYGFKTLEEYQQQKEKTNSIGDTSKVGGDIVSYILNLKKQLNEQEFTFESNTYKGQNSILSPEYNTYGFISSYYFFELSYNSSNTYTFNINKENNVTYLKNIEITPITDNYTIGTNIPYTIKLEYKTTGKSIDYNSKIKIKANNQELESGINTLTQNYENKYCQDLEIKINTDPLSSNKLIYSYIIPNFFNWTGKYAIIPTPSINTTNYSSTNYLNFRDSSFTWTPVSEDVTTNNQIQLFDTLLSNYSECNNIFEFGKEFEIEFNGGNIPFYDYLIFDENYDIDFYYNEIKSNNWYLEIRNGKYIYQSPQQYIGKHTWKVKIHPNN